jgi:hypothetical protein
VRHRITLGLATLALVLTGCISAVELDALRLEDLRARASSDFDCPATQLRVHRVRSQVLDGEPYDTTVARVHGCGQRATYVRVATGRDSEPAWWMSTRPTHRDTRVEAAR